MTSSHTSGWVLVVDDHAEIRALHAAQLQQAGYDVVAVADAGVAMATVAARPGCALVLSDVVMPGTSGIELAGWLAQHHPGIAVVLMSGYLGMVPGGGVDLDWPLLRKPISRAELLAAVASALAGMPTSRRAL